MQFNSTFGVFVMYAVIKTGGKQYRVKVGERLKIETVAADIGETINFPEVLMLTDGEKSTIGSPLVANALVQAEVIDHARHKKVKIIKFRRRKHHMKQMGHRQYYTEVKITHIATETTEKKTVKGDNNGN